MRQQKPPQPAAPECLCRFVADEWPGTEDPFRAWCRARLDFVRDNEGTVLGDALDVLKVHRDMKRKWACADD